MVLPGPVGPMSRLGAAGRGQRQRVKTQRRRRTDWSRPIAIMSANMAEPPSETNGRGRPVTGMMPTVIPILTNACTANQIAMPAATSMPNWSSAMLLRNEAAGDQPTMEQAGAASVCLARGEYAEYCARHDAWHGDVMSIPHVLLALLAEGKK